MSHRESPRTGRGCFSAVLVLPLVLLGGGVALLVLFGWGERARVPRGEVEVADLPAVVSTRPSPPAVTLTHVEQPVALREVAHVEPPPPPPPPRWTPARGVVPTRDAPPPVAAVDTPPAEPPAHLEQRQLVRAETPTTTPSRRLLSPVLPPPSTTEAAEVPLGRAAVEPSGTESPIPPTTT
ncbi:hypothetical protein [Saccharothrix coeruleofusca]|uniref:hypothetical protein n=1 Tax=Saccharothrix coeruleofusca TaxID=33919 RepID=UPI0016707089|nr:hypothetical protein [Saccharothrix coeruleofusca]